MSFAGMDVTIDDELPQLYIPSPQCSHCGHDVQLEDDCAWCETCLVSWPRVEDGLVGKPDEDSDWTGEPCGDTREPALRRQWPPGGELRHEYSPCILPGGHYGNHLHPLRQYFVPNEATAA